MFKVSCARGNIATLTHLATPRSIIYGGTYYADPDGCECSVPYYNLAEACAYCGTGDKNRGTTKDDFFKKCSKNNIDVSNQFPSKVTDKVVVPPWANMSIPASGNWSYEEAQSYASDNPTPTESSKPTDVSDHTYSVGAVVGGTLGGVAALAIVIGVGVLFWCRRSSTAARRRRLMMRAQGIPTKVKDTDSIFEIDDDEPRQDRQDDLDKTYIPVPYTGSITSARQSGAGFNMASDGRSGQHSHRRSQPLNNIADLDDENSIYSRPGLQSPIPAVRKGVEAGYDGIGSTNSYILNKHNYNQSDAGVSLYTDSAESVGKGGLVYSDYYKRNHMI